MAMVTLAGCRHGYKVENDRVYYEYWHAGLGIKQGKRLIEVADAKSFKPLSFDGDINFKFGKDKNYLFIDGEAIKNIDPNTFTFIGNYIFRDKDSAYFFGFYNNLNDCVIKGVNPDKIELIKYPWAKAGNILINGKDTVYLDDINEFVPIDDNWGKTKKQIINKKIILYGADVETFQARSSFQGKDKNFSYEFGFISDDDLKKTSYKTFDFDKIDFCESEPWVFVDIYDSMMSFTEDLNQRIEIVEKLKLKGYTITNLKGSNSNESKIISVILTNNNCNCYVEKFYSFDYSQPSDTGKVFKVTERIHCVGK